MQVDLFMEFAAPPMTGRSVAETIDDGLAFARAADGAGFGAVWLAEHHFLGDYCNAAAPDMLLAAMARETRLIGLGFAVVPLPLHDPVRVAERLATLDLLSHGRMMWGVGRGVGVTELQAFGIDPAESRTIFRRNLDLLREILRTGEVVRDGRRFALAPRLERPVPGGWLAAVSPDSFDLAATLDLDVMVGPFKPWPLVRADLARYRARRPGGRTSYTLAVYCDRDHRAARRRAEPGLRWVYRRILDIARPMLERELAGYEHYRRLGRLAPLFDRMLSVPLLERLGLAAVGDPDHVARRLRKLQAAGVDRVGLAIGGGDLERTETLRCIELIAERVVPALGESAARGREPVPA